MRNFLLVFLIDPDFRVNQLVAAAVTGLLANPTVPNNPKEVARMAVVQAKAVIDELDGE